MNEKNVIPEAIGQSVLFILSACVFGLAYRERLVHAYPQLHLMMAIVLAVFLAIVDVALFLWFGQNDAYSDIVHYVPSTFYTILVIYNLLPFSKIWQSVLVGLLVGIVQLTVTALLPTTSVHRSDRMVLIATDTLYFFVANLMGTFTKCLNEITMRIAFLDRRRCIDTTIKLDYEKSQEVSIYNQLIKITIFIFKTTTICLYLI